MKLKKISYFIAVASLLISGVFIFHSSDSIKAESEMPSHFDLRDYNIVSDVKSQGSYGTCWTFSPIGSLETQIMKQDKTIDLSEWHLAFFSYNHNECNDAFNPEDKQNVFKEGGYNNIAAATLTKWIGPVTEDVVPYGSGYPSEDKKFMSSYQVQDIYNITPWISRRKKYSDETMKELIYDKNSLSCTFCADTENYCNTATCSFFYPGPDYNYMEDSKYHCILVIGWDDNYPKENFRSDARPEHDGAWLCKNSWGNSDSMGGYCWISYEDRSLIEAAAYHCDPAGTYQHNYYYDNYGWSTSLSTNILGPPGSGIPRKPTGYMSNVFTAELDELVSAVSFYTIEPDASYEIWIYTDIDPNAAPDPRITTGNERKPSGYPASGIMSDVTSGSEKYAGYHTVRLNNPVRIHEDETFSVIVKITNPSSLYVIPIDAAVYMHPNDTHKPTTVNVLEQDIASFSFPNQSFASADGVSWYDLYNHTILEPISASTGESALAPDIDIYINKYYYIRIRYGHACVKAFTTPYTPLCGDVDDNSTVNASDVSLLVRKLLSDTVTTENDKIFFDLNRDNEFNVIDFYFIKRILETN